VESEARFRRLAEHAQDLIYRYEFAPRRGFTYVSPSATPITGYTPEDHYADPDLGLKIVHPDDRPLLEQYFQSGGVFYTPIVLRWRRKDGEIIWTEQCNVPVFDAQGKLVAIEGIARDITGRKRAEAALRATLAELQRSNTDLEQFAHVVSHDLQEPLRMVIGFLELLAERYQGRLDRDAEEFIGFAVDGARRMQNLIHALLEYARVSTRGQELRPVDANQVLAEAFWNLGLAIAEAGARVTHDPLPTVLADPMQLMQLFQNLIGNALKFRRAEPPVVHISARPATCAETGAAMWEFQVRDNGIGIAPENIGRIFGLFERLHTRQKYPGEGIGLAVCKKIVERHGGRIWVESVPEEGSTFHFTLPAADSR
ncbi:MAG: ATP-binding protein, partial [Anaerolineae bacterium]|nr:ATP-binding protein [Anaerolineae bacterium]